MTPIEQQMHDDLQWTVEHHAELEQLYSGKLIVVWRKAVVAYGTDEEKLLQQAASVERPLEQLVVVEFPAFLETPR